MRHALLLFTLLLTCFYASATHNRGGNITYTHLGGNTYQATVMTCTYSNAPADRDELQDFNWGDGTQDTLVRDSIVPYIHPSNPLYDSQKNYYSGIHTYAGPGTYEICMTDPNRNDQVINILNSVQVEFSLKTVLVISPFGGGYNNSVQLTECPCPELACVNHIYCYNIAAFDPDGDSLVYELVPPLGANCQPLTMPTQYVFPDAPMGAGDPSGGGGNMSIDPITGTMCWDEPNMIGMFNFTIRISEYRGSLFMGSVIRDIQLFVLNDNCDNDEPEIEPLPDTCVLAGDNVNIPVIFSDDVGATLTAYGEPFVANPPAFISNPVGGNPDTALFTWNTGCSNVQANPYASYFVAQDGGDPVQLQDIETMFITVNGPPVTGLTVSPSGNGMQINWDPNICTNITAWEMQNASRKNDQ